MPERIQRSRAKGWKMPPNTVYVGRPTKWGNPFTLEHAFKADIQEEQWHLACVDAFTNWFNYGDLKTDPDSENLDFVRKNLHHLKGKNLACWCPKDKPCHADVLIKLANS